MPICEHKESSAAPVGNSVNKNKLSIIDICFVFQLCKHVLDPLISL